MTDTEKQQWHDIKLKDHDIDLDIAGIPTEVVDRDTIAQDIQSMLYETGLVVELIGQRNESLWQLKQQQIIDEVEADLRVIPGTVTIIRSDYQTLFLQADTVKGPVQTMIDLTDYQGATA